MTTARASMEAEIMTFNVRSFAKPHLNLRDIVGVAVDTSPTSVLEKSTIKIKTTPKSPVVEVVTRSTILDKEITKTFLKLSIGVNLVTGSVFLMTLLPAAMLLVLISSAYTIRHLSHLTTVAIWRAQERKKQGR